MSSQALYLVLGLAGLPVFAASPILPQGFARLLGPTGGYLMSYPIAAFAAGYLAERGFDRRYLTSVVAMGAGLTIIFTRPFRVGEYISIAGEEGLVQTISLFSTTLLHSDLSQVVIPNRKIAGEILHNYGELRQLNLSVGVAYATDLDAAIATIREVLSANARVLKDPKPVVQAAVLGEFAINLVIRPWVAVKDFGAAPGEINPEIVRAFRERGIDIPFPTLRTVMVPAAE